MKIATVYYPAADLDDLAAIRELVESSSVAAGGDPDLVADLVLAVNEAVCNIITHGYQNEPGSVEVIVEQTDHDLLVRLRDEAPPFDPTTVPTPDVTRPLEIRRLGGMGVHMMRQFTDELSYGQTADELNELVMVKHNVIAKPVSATGQP
jgi:anti-sigma regulatory factor (Ser/Thr protein kinase)